MFCPEFKILQQSVRLYNNSDAIEAAERIIKINQIDWEDLYYRADINSVRPQMAQLISKIDPVLIPDDFKNKLNKAYKKNLYDQLSYSLEFLKVRKYLDEAGIPVIPFKGFWLAFSIYDNLADREASDVDIFIDIKDLERIQELMKGIGYKPENIFKPFTIEEIKKRFGEYNFEKIEDGIKKFHFEFHWQISNANYGMGISYNDLKSQITSGRMQDQVFPVYSPSANLLLAIMHHGGKDTFRELKQVLDIGMILNKDKYIDWEWVLGMAKRFNIEKIVYTAIKISSDLIGIEVPGIIRKHVGFWKTKNLAKNRIRFLSKLPGNRHRLITLNDWIFRIRSRSSFKIKLRLFAYIMGHVLLRYMAPAKVRKRVLRMQD